MHNLPQNKDLYIKLFFILQLPPQQALGLHLLMPGMALHEQQLLCNVPFQHYGKSSVFFPPLQFFYRPTLYQLNWILSY